MENAIGRRPISDIEPFEVLAALKVTEKWGNYETSRRTVLYHSLISALR
ncbi:phage integrase central domain-containing protein [Asticcacaulis sp. W401b]